MITLKNVVLRRSAKVLLDSASVTINPGEKVGLVGRNGAGKSTLFALLNGTLHEDGGDFYVPPQWRLAQVAQDMPETEQSATCPCKRGRPAGCRQRKTAPGISPGRGFLLGAVGGYVSARGARTAQAM